jgi:acyl carrier protein
MTADQDAVAAELRRMLADVTGRPDLIDLPAPTPLFGGGVGLDSLAGTLLLRRIQRQFGVDVAAEDLNLDSLATLDTLAAFVAERLSDVVERSAGASVRPAESEPQEQQRQRHD